MKQLTLENGRGVETAQIDSNVEEFANTQEEDEQVDDKQSRGLMKP